MRFGSEEQKRLHLGPMSEGRVIWCQGFSEPDAGSDLLSLRTTAQREGEGYVINGQKVWTSYASDADFCFLLGRTGPPHPRHESLSVFLVPMNSPGIEVRRIGALVGGHAFHEMFLTDVRVSHSALLGAEGQGLEVAREALSFERVGLPRYVRAEQVLEALAKWAEKKNMSEHDEVYRRLGEALTACESARLLVYQVVDERSIGLSPSASVHLARAAIVEAERLVGDVAVEVMEEESMATDSIGDSSFRNSLAVGIASGTYEMQLNQIAYKLLQLPKR
jgi:alkylation response protein AidB-like acyl-CoA dehydrogenase